MWGRNPPNMRITLGWARCADNVADVLRRGAWYPVVEESSDGHVIVEVRRQRIRLSRADVTFRTEPPDHWSVVVRTGVLRPTRGQDRKSTRLNSSHRCISYAVFCLKKKKKNTEVKKKTKK